MMLQNFWVWMGDDDWIDAGRLIAAKTPRGAAESLAEKVVRARLEEADDDEFADGDEIAVAVSVTPEDRPHARPARFTIQVEVEVEVRTEVDREAHAVPAHVDGIASARAADRLFA